MRTAIQRLLSITGMAAMLLGVAPVSSPAQDRVPKLVVQITVDQLRGDHLERLDPMFTGGLRRILDEGRVYTRATVDHATTSSFPGHTALATGMHPRNHGVPESIWLHRGDDGQLQPSGVFAGQDHTVPGIPDLSSGGPERIEASSLAEWMAGAHPDGRFAAIGGGEYASLLHAVHRRGDVYWYIEDLQGFGTSTYYRDDIPAWVSEAGAEAFQAIEANSVWQLAVPEEFYHLARRDEVYYENGGRDTAFPHPASAYEDLTLAQWISRTPWLDDMTFAVVNRAIDELELGQGDRTDFLSIVASATDHVGHRWGPRSLEHLDTLYRLDRHLGQLFEKLDRDVGRGNYVVALSADHGASNAPEWDLENGEYAVRLADDSYAAFITFVRELANGYEGPDAGLKLYLMREIKKHPLVADTFDVFDVLANPQTDPYLRLYHNAARPERIFLAEIMTGSLSMDGHPLQYGIGVRFLDGVSVGSRDIPGLHGSPYFTDQHVALAFWGAGIAPATVEDEAHTVDVAPTLACLAGVMSPEGLDGRILFGAEACGR